MTDVVIGYQGDAEEFEEKQALILEKQAHLDEIKSDDISEEEEDEMEEFDELEYTGPNEEEVYERFEKIQKTFKSYVRANDNFGYINKKQSKLERNLHNVSQS